MNHDGDDTFWPPNKVGYKNPPKSSQFKKGKSGNPRGRPPKKKQETKSHVDKSTMETVLKVALREVTVREGEDISKTPVVAAVIQTMAAAAMKGNVQAQKAFVELVDRARKDQTAQVLDDHEFWRNYAATYDSYVEALHKAKEPLPEYLVHPDDLEFEEGRHVTVKGGDPVEATRNRNLLIQFRDVLMLQSEQDRRYYPFKEEYERDTSIFISDVLLIHINSFLPKRMQLSDNQIQFRQWKIMCLPNRMLEQQLKARLSDLGATYRRNQTTWLVRLGLRN